MIMTVTVAIDMHLLSENMTHSVQTAVLFAIKASLQGLTLDHMQHMTEARMCFRD